MTEEMPPPSSGAFPTCVTRTSGARSELGIRITVATLSGGLTVPGPHGQYVLVMNVLWVAPWFRTLGRAWAKPLRDSGHEVLVVTSERHFEGQSAGAPEVLVTQSPRT